MMTKNKFAGADGRLQKGFTLVETVLAVAIIGAISVTLLRAIDTNTRATGVLDEKVTAVNLTTAYLEAIRQMDYSDNATPYNTAGDGISVPFQYSVQINAEYSSNGVDWVDTRTDEELQRITVLVLREGGKVLMSTCTLRASR